MCCEFCPSPEGERCIGLSVRRFCELIDPSCPEYNPGYRDVIVSEGIRARATNAAVEPETDDLLAGPPGVLAGDCCGGARLGMFDAFDD